MSDDKKSNVIPFPTKGKKKTKSNPTIVTFTPENFPDHKYEIKEFTFDLDGLKGMVEDPNFDTDSFIDNYDKLPAGMLDKIFADVRKEVSKDSAISDVHDACFEVSLLAEQYPEHAAYIETKVQQLVKQLIMFLSNRPESNT